MCQLTLTDLGNFERNAGVTLFSAMINAEHNAPHGFGLFNGTEVWKTELRANEIPNLGDILRYYITTDVPIISHVRLASKGIELKPENNHPFETNDFIGAHNGTLYLKEESAYGYSATNNESRGSDSKRFFEMMQAEYTKNGGKFIPAIKDTMSKHKGKFAFLIYEKPTQTYYVIKGRTADLHTCDIFRKKKYIGFVVNTEKNDLEKIVMQTINYWGLIGLGDGYTHSDIVELEDESIYEVVKNKLKKVDSIPETSAYEPVKNTSTVLTKISGMSPSASMIKQYFNSGGKKSALEGILGVDGSMNIICEFMKQHFLTPYHMDLIFYKALSISLVEAEEEEIFFFVKNVMPKISANKSTRKIFSREHIDTVKEDFYLKYGLQFPWMCNTRKELEKAVTKFVLDKAAAEKNKTL